MSTNEYGGHGPQIIDFTLQFWESEGKWVYQSTPLPKVRFHVLGQPYGKNRWRCHLTQHLDPLPLQNKKDSNSLLITLQQAISELTSCSCMAITIDLLDYVKQDEDV